MADNRDRKKKNKGREKDSEWQERVVQIRRVTKVVKGGKKLSFRAIVVVGNEKGQVGVGVGKNILAIILSKALPSSALAIRLLITGLTITSLANMLR